MIFILFLYFTDVFATIQNNDRRKPLQAQSHHDFHLRGTHNNMLVEFRTTIDVHVAGNLQGYCRPQSTKSTLVSPPIGNHVTDKLPYYYNSSPKLHDDTRARRRPEQLTTRRKNGKQENIAIPVQSSDLIPRRRKQFLERHTGESQRNNVNIELYPKSTDRIQMEAGKISKNNGTTYPVFPAIRGWRQEFPGRLTRLKERSSVKNDHFYFSRIFPIIELTKTTDYTEIMKNIADPVTPAISAWRMYLPGPPFRTNERSIVEAKYPGFSRDFTVQPKITIFKSWQLQYPKINERFPEPEYLVGISRGKNVQPKRTDHKWHRKNKDFSVSSAIPTWQLKLLDHSLRMNVINSEPEYQGLSRDTLLKTTNKKGKRNNITFTVSPAIPSWRMKFPGLPSRTDKRYSADPESYTVQRVDQKGENKIMAYSVYQAKRATTPDSWQQLPGRRMKTQEKSSTNHKNLRILRTNPVTVQPKRTNQKGHKKDITFSIYSAIPGWRLQFTDHVHPTRMNEIYSEPEYQDFSRDTLLKTINKKGKSNNITFPVSPAIPGWQLEYPNPKSRKDKRSSVDPEHLTVWRDNLSKTTVKKSENIALLASPAIPGWRLEFPSHQPAKDKRFSADPESFTVQRTNQNAENKVTAYSNYQETRPAIPASRPKFPDRPLKTEEKSSTRHKYQVLSRDIPFTVQPNRSEQKGHKKNITFSISSAIPGWRLQFHAHGHSPRMKIKYQGLLQDTLLKTTYKKEKSNNINFPVSPAIPGWRLAFPGSTNISRNDNISSVDPEYLTVQTATDKAGENKTMAYSVYQAKRPATTDSRLQFSDRSVDIQNRSSPGHKYRDLSRDIVPVATQPKRTDQQGYKKNIGLSVPSTIPGWRQQITGDPPGKNQRYSEPEYQGLSQKNPVSVHSNVIDHKGNIRNNTFSEITTIKGWKLQYHDQLLKLKESSSDGPEYVSYSQYMTMKTTYNKGSKNIGHFKGFKVRPPAIPGWRQQFLDRPFWMNEKSLRDPEYPSVRGTPVSVHRTDQKGHKKEIAISQSPVIPGWRLQFPSHHPRMNEISMKSKYSHLLRNIPFSEQVNDTKKKKKNLAFQVYQTKPIPKWPQQFLDNIAKPNKLNNVEPEYSGLSQNIPVILQPKTTDQKGVNRDIPLVTVQGMNQRKDKNDFGVSVYPAIPGWHFPRPLDNNKINFDGPEHASLLRELGVNGQSNATFKKDYGIIIAYSVAPAFPDSRLNSPDPPPRKEDAKIITYSFAPAFTDLQLESPNRLPKMNEGYSGEPKNQGFSPDTRVTVQEKDQKQDTKNIKQNKPPAITGWLPQYPELPEVKPLAIATWRPQYPEIPAITNVRSSDEFPVLKKYLENYPEGTMTPEETQYTQYDKNFAESIVRKRQKINLDVEVKVKMSVP